MGRGNPINKSIFQNFIKNPSSWENIFGMLSLTGRGSASGREPPHYRANDLSEYLLQLLSSRWTVREPKLATAMNRESEQQ